MVAFGQIRLSIATIALAAMVLWDGDSRNGEETLLASRPRRPNI